MSTDGFRPDRQLSAAPPPVDDRAIDDLRSRLRAYRRVPLSPGGGWDRGVDHGFLDELLGYWADGYDWRAHERRILDYPWFVGGVGETPVRGIHLRGAQENGSVPVLLLHGWPDSVLRFERLLPLLDGMDVVVPALPGFPFAAPVRERGMSSGATAKAIAALMQELGYQRYVISAGDVGCDVAEVLAGTYPERVAALHLTDVSQYRFLVDLPSDLTEAERAYVDHGHRWQAQEGGYMHEQATKPHTLSVGLGDSPAALASWIIEKLRSWTDCGGDLQSVFSRDDILTWVSAYWFSGCIGTSFAPYAEGGAKPTYVSPPTNFTIFPKDLVNAPREFAERFFNVVDFRELGHGGHFAAWERPADYLAGIQRALQFV